MSRWLLEGCSKCDACQHLRVSVQSLLRRCLLQVLLSKDDIKSLIHSFQGAEEGSFFLPRLWGETSTSQDPSGDQQQGVRVSAQVYNVQCKMYRVFKTVSLRSSKAFKAMGDTVLKTLFKAFQDRPDIFTTIEQPINSLQEFEKEFFFALKDFHKTAIQRYQPCFSCVMQCNILCR